MMKKLRQPIHGKEEVQLLKLLKQVQKILAKALNSLGGKSPPSPESNYLSRAAISVNKAADGYLYLRKSGRVDASKLLVRPALEATFSGIAVIKKPGFLFRKAYTEWKQDKKLYAKNAAEKLAAEHALNKLVQIIEKANPNSPIKREEVTMYDAAEAAELLENYDAYRVYCQFTHGAMRAVLGELSKQTDKIDTKIVIWCVIMILDHLKEKTPAQIPCLSSLKKKLIL
jgi:Family of unknown function (DUF5677)